MTEGGSQHCQLAVDEAIKVASDLNEFVVAFDRIFSRIAFGEANSDLLTSYVLERNVRQRLASARSAIFDAIEEVIGQRSQIESRKRVIGTSTNLLLSYSQVSHESVAKNRVVRPPLRSSAFCRSPPARGGLVSWLCVVSDWAGLPSFVGC